MLPPSPLDPFSRIRRAALSTILRISVVGTILTLLLGVVQQWGAAYFTGFTLLLLELSLLLAWLTRRPEAHPAVSVVYFTFSALISVGTFGWSALQQFNLASIGVRATWLPLLYLTAFLVLPPRRATRAAVSIFVVVLGIMLTFFLLPDVPRATKADAINTTLQIALSHGLLITLFAMWGRLLGGALTEARSAYEDALTHLPNRRQLNVWLADAVNAPSAAILFDLDHFKCVNDTHGHDVGDDVLRQTGLVLAQALPGDARFGRWGGEEFLVIVPAHAAPRVADTLAQSIRTHAYPQEIQLTASFGVAFTRAGEDAQAWLARADDALYAAKRAGRARIHIVE